MTAEGQNLKILSIFHYVVAGLAALFSLFPVIHIVIGVMMVLGKLDDGSSPSPEPFGWVFIAMGAVFMVAGMAFAACYAYAGRCLSRHRHYMYCLVMAGVGCMFVPFGTVLGVFTIIELQKEPVKRLFMPAGPSTTAAAAP
jgi:drug/metabolite transporter (DMT)-like permease